MPLPAAITPITVSGKFLRPNGAPAAGLVRFTPSIAAATLGAVVPISPLAVSLDAAGAFSVILAATDDADWAAAGWTYTVTEQIRGAKERSYSITVPAASPGGALDLATVIPVGIVGAVSPYLLVAGGTLTGGLDLASTFAGGENTSDSTSRITLHSHQRAQRPNHFGEPLRLVLERDNAKAMVAWQENYTGNGPRSVAWIGAHGLSNDGLSWHNHISIEVPDETGAIQTQLEIPFAPWNTPDGYGISATDVYVRSIAKFIAASQLKREGAAGLDRDIDLGTTDGSNVGGLDAYRRWSIRVDSTAEGGSSVGSDFRIVRRNDSGAVVATALFVKRDTGVIGINGITAPAARLDITEAGLRHGLQVTRSAAGADNFAVVAGSVGNASNRYFDFRVSGDATARLVVRGDGGIELGDGGAGGRDTNLYRSAANVLSTDDSFTVGSNFRHFGTGIGFYSAAAVAKPTVSGSRGGNAALASLLTALASLGLVTDSTTA